MIYTCQVWGQKENQIKKISELQGKALRIINFKPINHPVLELPIYQNNKILLKTPRLPKCRKPHSCVRKCRYL